MLPVTTPHFIARFVCFLAVLSFSLFTSSAKADGIVSKITSSPIFANGAVTDIRTGNNIFLQRSDAPHYRFLDPKVVGYGIEAGGRMEVEMLAGFERDPNIPLDASTLLLVAGTPQQAITSKGAGYTISEGANPYTFVIKPTKPEGMIAEKLIAKAPAAKTEPIPQKGIKIIHIGRNMAFINRGSGGEVAVRLYGADGSLLSQGKAIYPFFEEPRPQIFPTNIPDLKRNRNWQRAKSRQIVGTSKDTLPLSFLLFDRNEGFGNKGLDGVGVLSVKQLVKAGFNTPTALKRFDGGLILQDMNGDKVLDPRNDRIIGGVRDDTPEGAIGYFATTPIVKGRAFLSRPTGLIDKKAGKRPGGSILDVVYVAGSKPGIYRPTFTLLKDLSDVNSGDGSSYTYTILVE